MDGKAEEPEGKALAIGKDVSTKPSVASLVEEAEHRAEQKVPAAGALGQKQQKNVRKTSDATEKRSERQQYELKMREIELSHEREMEKLRLKYRRETGTRKERDCDESEDSELYEEVRANEDKVTRRQMMARKSVPKNLPAFDGDPEMWPLFYCSFRDTTETCGFSNIENLQRLRDSLRGKALEAVRGRLLLPESVPSVIEDLRCLFGRPERLLKTLIKKVRNTPAPNANRLGTFIPFGIAVKQLCDHLKASKMEDHLNNPLLVDELVAKLPASNKMDWVRYKRHACGQPLCVFADFIDDIMCDASEVDDFFELEEKRTDLRKQPAQGNVHMHSEIASTPPKSKTCWRCKNESHRIRNCEQFKQDRVEEREQLVEKWKLCKSCLNNHRGMCRFQRKCGTNNCDEYHHPLLHRERVVLANETCSSHYEVKKGTVFRIVPVILRSGELSYETSAFLDEGSSVTMIEDTIANKLKLKGICEPFTVSWTADVSRREEKSRKMDIRLSAKGKSEEFILKGVRTVSKLVLPKQEVSFNELKVKYDHLKDLPVEGRCSKQPQVLIGLDNLDLFAPIEARIGQPNEPIGVRSKLGWTIYGPQAGNYQETEHVLSHYVKPISNEVLHDLLRSQYSLEESGVSSRFIPESSSDARARELLKSTTVRVNDRFQTGLLWKTDCRRFPDSFAMAKRRLVVLKRKFAKNPQLESAVRQIVTDYVDKQYAHKLTQHELENSPPSTVWYLPLNVVLNPRKPGKIRLVWDAAATVEGVSLNSELLKGPDMLTSLLSVILPFRERRIGFGGDIKEMYHQIRMRPEDKQAQRFLFPACGDETDPQIFVLDVATFGATCSPCSAQYVKNLNAEQFREQFPKAYVAIRYHHYVDDYFDSVDSVEEALELANEVKHVHSKGGFVIRNWVSNSEIFCGKMGETPASEMIALCDKSVQIPADRVLGISWDVKDDCFRFLAAPNLHENSYPTKRSILSSVMTVFDPLGFLSPITVLGKMIVQDLWRAGCAWDEEVPQESYQRWQSWMQQMKGIERVKIPRAYFGEASSSEVTKLQLHVFTDASENAYGCVAYLRAMINDKPHSMLVMSKTKVAPLKQLTIPRMELLAALMGARMAKTVEESHRIEVAKRFFWIDSRTVLSWIRSNQRQYKLFVALRIGEILELSRVTEWHWIPTKENIADVLTKKSSLDLTDVEGAWYNGPGFLHESEIGWPRQPEVAANTEEELRATNLFHDVKLPDMSEVIFKVSKWTVLVRVIARVFRFISNLRRKTTGLEIECFKRTVSMEKKLRVAIMKSGRKQVEWTAKGNPKSVRAPLKQEEYKKAEQFLFKLAQSQAYADEVKLLTKNKNLPSDKWHRLDKHSELYRLTPLLDEDGILRVEGRTAYAETLPFDLRFPIILPSGHEITRKLIGYYHEKKGHALNESVKNDLRLRFHITNANAEVKKVIKACIWCRVHKTIPRSPKMAPLPLERLKHHYRPFSYVGVDYFGPVEVTIGRSKHKRWIVLFTCLVVRAVHLEVAHGLSGAACLMAVRRFICRRGSPREFISDNGTNLKAASKEITQQIRDVEEFCAEGVTDARTGWRFIPPGTPHMGGSWERLVRTVKEALEVLVGGTKLTDEILLTALTEAEDMTNSRPLTYVADEGSEALTPNHFLRGVSPSEHELLPPVPNAAEALRNSYHRSQLLAEEMWQRWIREYVTKVNNRAKWYEDAKPLRVGDLVYVVDGKNRKMWTRGRVEEVDSSKDGRCRHAWIRTKSGLIKRATSNLAVLDLEGNK